MSVARTILRSPAGAGSRARSCSAGGSEPYSGATTVSGIPPSRAATRRISRAPGGRRARHPRSRAAPRRRHGRWRPRPGCGAPAAGGGSRPGTSGPGWSPRPGRRGAPPRGRRRASRTSPPAGGPRAARRGPRASAPTRGRPGGCARGTRRARRRRCPRATGRAGSDGRGCPRSRPRSAVARRDLALVAGRRSRPCRRPGRRRAATSAVRPRGRRAGAARGRRCVRRRATVGRAARAAGGWSCRRREGPGARPGGPRRGRARPRAGPRRPGAGSRGTWPPTLPGREARQDPGALALGDAARLGQGGAASTLAAAGLDLVPEPRPQLTPVVVHLAVGR